MTRTLRIFILGGLLIGLSSCSHEKAPETRVVSRPTPPKAKPIPPVAVPKPTSVSPQSSSHKVGLLLPLTGPHAALGKGMMDAAELALFEIGGTSITLYPQDTSQGAHQAALRALDEGAEILLGPIFAAEVEAIKPLLSARNINLISFSTDHAVAGNGVFILGFLPSQQIELILNFAKERNLTKIAALTPNDQYGRLIDQTLRRLESQGHIELLGITHYSKADLLEGNPGNARIIEEVEEYKAKGLTALLIPEGGENLGYMAILLRSQMPLTILGSGQWDAPNTLQVVTHLKESFFASTDPQEWQNFDLRFQKAYGYNPPRISTLAYDATALAIALADKGYTFQNLTFSQGFSGVDGIFRLTNQGLNERGLVVLEVTHSGFRTIRPAPRTF